MAKERWDPEILTKLKPEERHLVWLDHEARFHSDPATQQIIKEIKMMLRPDEFIDIQSRLGAAYAAIDAFREIMK